jgi:hypothetical protein
MDNLAIFEALTNNDTNEWQIDWFGYVLDFDAHKNGPSEVLLDVYLSKVGDKPIFDRQGKLIGPKPRRIEIPVEYLCILRLGDVWKKGALIRPSEEHHAIAYFEDIDISDYNTYTVHSGYKGSDSPYFIPYTFHRGHRSATKVNCEVIEISPERKIIIPHYVIIQAYFSSSSYVIKQLFGHGLYRNLIYDPASSFLDDDHAYILLNQRVHDVAAAEVARIAFDNNARYAASLISESLTMRRFVLPGRLNPKTKLPFIGKTDWKVYGKWLDNDQNDFIVFGIINCSAKLPFETLEFYKGPSYEPKTPKPADGGGPKEGGSPRWPGPKIPKPPYPLNLEPSDLPDNESLNIHLVGRSAANLVAISKEGITKRREVLPGDGRKGGPPETKGGSHGNTGDGQRGGDGIPVDFQDTKRFKFPTPICRLELFQKIVTELRKKKGVNSIQPRLVKFQAYDDELVGIAEFPEFSDKKREKLSKWRYSSYIKGVPLQKGMEHVLRKVAIIDVAVGSKRFYLFEAQRRIIPYPWSEYASWIELDSLSFLVIVTAEDNILSDSRLTSILINCVRCSGGWFESNKKTDKPEKTKKTEPDSEGLTWSNLWHPHDSTVYEDDYVTKVISSLEELIGYKFD